MVVDGRESVGESERRSQDVGNPYEQDAGKEEEGEAFRESQIEDEDRTLGKYK